MLCKLGFADMRLDLHNHRPPRFREVLSDVRAAPGANLAEAGHDAIRVFVGPAKHINLDEIARTRVRALGAVPVGLIRQEASGVNKPGFPR